MSNFHTTHWSLVLAAIGNDTVAAGALKILCQTYYEPVRAYIERAIRGDSSRIYGGRNADDLSHDFFLSVLSGKVFSRLECERGRFRSYLLGALRHFLSHVREAESSLKRGGHLRPGSLEFHEPASLETDDGAFFDREWAQKVVDSALNSLGETRDTKLLLPWLMREMPKTEREKIAAELQLGDVAVKVALHRLRRKFRTAVHSLVAETLESDSELEAELEHLIKALMYS